jgi:hypothetical protein
MTRDELIHKLKKLGTGSTPVVIDHGDEEADLEEVSFEEGSIYVGDGDDEEDGDDGDDGEEADNVIDVEFTEKKSA